MTIIQALITGYFIDTGLRMCLEIGHSADDYHVIETVNGNTFPLSPMLLNQKNFLTSVLNISIM